METWGILRKIIRGGKSTQNKKFTWTSFFEQLGKKAKFARNFRKSSCKRGVFWYFAILGGFWGPLTFRETRGHKNKIGTSPTPKKKTMIPPPLGAWNRYNVASWRSNLETVHVSPFSWGQGEHISKIPRRSQEKAGTVPGKSRDNPVKILFMCFLVYFFLALNNFTDMRFFLTHAFFDCPRDAAFHGNRSKTRKVRKVARRGCKTLSGPPNPNPG